MSHFEDSTINLQSLWTMPKIHGKRNSRKANAHAFYFKHKEPTRWRNKKKTVSTKAPMLTMLSESGNGNFNGPHTENDDQSMTNAAATTIVVKFTLGCPKTNWASYSSSSFFWYVWQVDHIYFRSSFCVFSFSRNGRHKNNNIRRKISIGIRNSLMLYTQRRDKLLAITWHKKKWCAVAWKGRNWYKPLPAATLMNKSRALGWKRRKVAKTQPSLKWLFECQKWKMPALIVIIWHRKT